MTGTGTRIGTAVALALALAGCSGGSVRDGGGTSVLGAVRTAAAGVLPGSGARAAATPARTPEAMAADALRANPGPLILAVLESSKTTQVLALTGENAGQRTYMTKNEQGMILRGGMLIGTRGLGNDLSVAEPGTLERLVRTRQAGSGERIMRLYSGDGREVPIRFDCTVAGAAATPAGRPMTESCRAASGAAFQNTYLVGSGGAITASRQWISPRLGYVQITAIRP